MGRPNGAHVPQQAGRKGRSGGRGGKHTGHSWLSGCHWQCPFKQIAQGSGRALRCLVSELTGLTLEPRLGRGGLHCGCVDASLHGRHYRALDSDPGTLGGRGNPQSAITSPWSACSQRPCRKPASKASFSTHVGESLQFGSFSFGFTLGAAVHPEPRGLAGHRGQHRVSKSIAAVKVSAISYLRELAA